MASVSDTITWCIRNFPSLYECRSDVLDQLFCTIGNGYEWVNGELVDDYATNGDRPLSERFDNEEKMLAGDAFQQTAEQLPELMAALRLSLRRRNAEYAYRSVNAELLATISRPNAILQLKVKPVYPLCQYSALTTVPDDVKPDWLAAARESIFMVFAAPARRAAGPWTEEHVAAERKKNISVAEAALRDLATRFGNPDGLPTSYVDWKRSDCGVDE